MSSKELVDSAAQRLLNRCAQIEEAKKKVEETVESNNASSNIENEMSPSAYRQQLDQIRRVLVTSQENARLKQSKLEEENLLLKNELTSIKVGHKKKSESEQDLIAERDNLKAQLIRSMSWVKKSQTLLSDVNEENVQLRNLVCALKEGSLEGSLEDAQFNADLNNTLNDVTAKMAKKRPSSSKQPLHRRLMMISFPARSSSSSSSPIADSGESPTEDNICRTGRNASASAAIQHLGAAVRSNMKKADVKMKSLGAGVVVASVSTPKKAPRSTPAMK